MSISSVDSGPLHVKPQPDLNLETEANRILYVINRIITRAKLAGLLQNLVANDGFLLKQILDSNSHFYVLQACDKYHFSIFNRIPSAMQSQQPSQLGSSKSLSKKSMPLENENEDESDSSSSASNSDESDNLETKLKNRNDNALCKVIYMLEEKPEVLRILNGLGHELSPAMKYFIKCMQEFKNRMEICLHEDAMQYKTREKYLRETYDKNERAKIEINRLEEELVVTKTGANVCLIGRSILINRHTKKIEKITLNSQEAIEKRVNESEKAMVNDYKTSMAQQEKLKRDYDAATERYNSTLKNHLAIEKAMRAKRTKIENQVLGWIQKFDQDIGEKQAEEDEILRKMDDETQLVNEIQQKLDEQEEEYDELMQEKAEYEEEILERRLYQFIVNRSARRIQRTFRIYKARKLAKKLAKKGKKGKKGKKK